MFVDASVIVAILGNEPDRDEFVARLDQAATCVSSPVALFEAVLALSKRLGGLETANAMVDEFVSQLNMSIESVDRSLLPGLVNAHGRFGKGSGHPARLNMGDCFSYAMAKRAGLPLLYKGDDFAQTDLA
ncbi:VapC ribonuclease R02377 [Rhizobium albus]|jgi:ribonuclease VapC|nr:VapC ribonuclease R02377 [Rhizobium albus]